jgi:hypothetical protein
MLESLVYQLPLALLRNNRERGRGLGVWGKDLGVLMVPSPSHYPAGTISLVRASREVKFARIFGFHWLS